MTPTNTLIIIPARDHKDPGAEYSKATTTNNINDDLEI